MTGGPGANQMTVTWPAATGADSYDILYGTNPASLTQTATGVTSPHTLSGLTGAVTYYVRVRANNAIGSGTSILSTNQLSAIPVPLLSAPTGFTATATPGQVVLNWNAVSGASNYEVLRGTSTGSYTSLASGINATTYTDTTVSNGTSYYYVVRAFNGINGTLSSEQAVKPIQAFTISSTTSLSSSSIQVTWGAGAGADLYDVQYGTVSGSYTTTVSAVTSPYSITGLTANTTYYIVVRGRNLVGSGTSYTTAQSSALTETSAPVGLSQQAPPEASHLIGQILQVRRHIMSIVRQHPGLMVQHSRPELLSLTIRTTQSQTEQLTIMWLLPVTVLNPQSQAKFHPVRFQTLL